MARFNQTLINAVEAKTFTAYEMIYADIDGGLYLTNAPRDISYGGNTYLSLGGFLGFSAVEEKTQFTISEVTVTLAGVPAYDDNDSSFISLVLQHDYIDKQVKIYRAFFDRETFLDAFLMFEGRVSAPTIRDNPGDTATVAVTVSNNWVDYDRTNGVITNDSRQQALYPGDRIFEHAAETIKDISWKP